MHLTSHFTLEECTRSSTALRFGIPNELPETLKDNAITCAMGMERVRSRINRPIHIESWYRSAEVNRAVGGSLTSDHMKALAVDWWPADGKEFMTQAVGLILRAKEDIGFQQLIWEGSWIHISFPPLNIEPKLEILTAHFVPGKKTTYTQGITV